MKSTVSSRSAQFENKGPTTREKKCGRYLGELSFCLMAVGLACVLGSMPAFADPLPSAQSQIGGNALKNASGSISVNIAAGSENAQANVTAIGNAPQHSHPSVTQDIRASAIAPSSSSAIISGQALSGASGRIAVNQVSGVANAEANVASIKFGNPVGQDQLASVTPQQPSPTSGTILQGTNGVSITGTALTGTSGLVQVTQVAGSGNSAANTFALRMGQGLNP